MTFDPSHIGGKGNYVIENSIVKCVYDGEIEGNKGFVEIINLDNNQ